MIPKKIHYCWFGGKPLPELALKCIDSWKKYFPDYEIIEWNESNFDIGFNDFAKEAYDNGKFAFFTDVARLYIIYKHGGIYFDIDVEVIKKYDNVLNNSAFFGLENIGKVNTGLGFGAEKNNWMVKELLDDYNNRHFINQKDKIRSLSCPIINSKIFIKNGFNLNGDYEKIKNIAVFPIDYFNPKGGYGQSVNITNSTLSIHHFDGSWISAEEIKRANKLINLKKKYGNCLGKILFNTIFLPYRIVSKITEK